MGGAGETPTARIVAEAGAPLSVTDAQGRRIEFRRPGALDRLRLFKALGPGLSANDPYVGYAMKAPTRFAAARPCPARFVSAIP